MLIILRSAGLGGRRGAQDGSTAPGRHRCHRSNYAALFCRRAGGFKSLGSSKDAVPLPAIGIVTLERKIKEKPEQVKKILRTILKSLRFLRENREEAVRVAMA